MARCVLILCLVFPVCSLPAQRPVGTASPAEATPTPHKRDPFSLHSNQRKRTWEKLTPEQREKLRENYEHWKKLPESRRRMLREREHIREERIEREIEEALKQTQLQLTADQREVFALRYRQERRKIEQKLRQEMDEKRKPLVQEIIAELKQEFSASGSPASSPE